MWAWSGLASWRWLHKGKSERVVVVFFKWFVIVVGGREFGIVGVFGRYEKGRERKCGIWVIYMFET